MLQRSAAATGVYLRALTFALTAGAALLLTSGVGSAQEGGLSVTVTGFSMDGQAIVSVLDETGRPLAALGEEQFVAFLDGEPAAVRSVQQAVDSQLAVAVVLAIDVSGSMIEGGAIDQAKLSALEFLDSLGRVALQSTPAAEDSVAVLTFNHTVDLVQPFTQDRELVADAIRGLTAGGGTALYDATSESVRLAASAETGRPAIIVLSDGVDNGSVLSREAALAAAETAGVPVYVIGLGTEIDRAYLEALADGSGGTFAETPTGEGLAALYQEVAADLRGQYVLALDAASFAGTEQAATLRVEVSTPEGSGSGERVVCPQDVCVTLIGVEPGQRLVEAQTLEAQVLSVREIASVTFIVDGETVQEVTEPPYRFTFEPAALEEGEHTIVAQVRAVDGVTKTSETAVMTGPAGGLAIGGPVIPVALAAAGAFVGVAVVLFIRRRRRGGAEELDETPPLQPEPPLESREPPPGEPGRPRTRVMVGDDVQAVPPPLRLEEPLGRITAVSGPIAGESFEVGAKPISVGSGLRCRIQLPENDAGSEAEVAVEHARLWVREGHLMVHELRRLTAFGAAGGRWSILGSGESFDVGHTTFRFDLDSEAEAVGAVPSDTGGFEAGDHRSDTDAPSSPPGGPFVRFVHGAQQEPGDEEQRPLAAPNGAAGRQAGPGAETDPPDSPQTFSPGPGPFAPPRDDAPPSTTPDAPENGPSQPDGADEVSSESVWREGSRYASDAAGDAPPDAGPDPRG